MKGNQAVSNVHLHKDWKSHVRVWLDQAKRKKARRLARQKKAQAIFPRPVAGALRPVVRGQTVKYNMKNHLGRGFTLDELKEAGVNALYARTAGIAIDTRRRNRSAEMLQANVQRLKEYMSKLVVLPRKKSADMETAPELKQTTGTVMPLKKAAVVVEMRPVREEEQKFEAYAMLRKARADARLVGIRKKKAEEKAKATDDVKA